MNANEMEEIREEAQVLMDKVGKVLHDQHMVVVQLVLARLYAEVCVDSGMTKKKYLTACEGLWDALMEDLTEETKH
jgi:hypothetical protein